MRLVHFALLGAIFFLLVVAFTPKAVSPKPTPSHGKTPEPDFGGYCGDGRVLRPGEQCP